MLKINSLIRKTEPIKIIPDGNDKLVCFGGIALFRQATWEETETKVEMTEAIRGLLLETEFITAEKFPHDIRIDKQSFNLYAGELRDGTISVNIYDARYTKPIGKNCDVYFGTNTHNTQHRPLYVLNKTVVDAIIMPWNVSWNSMIYSFLKKSVEDWFKMGTDAINNFDRDLQTVLGNASAVSADE